MENFIVSARKYRPATFDMVVGQDTVVKTLKNAIKNKQIAHAYLFCGPRGVGKTTCARIFAKTINCFNLKDNVEACDECESCVSFNSSRSFNIHELDAASNNKVEDIRNLSDQVRIIPQVGKFSVYIIDEVHMLSSSAFNAFLKTLEEPPPHAIFILATTEKHKIIPTILSRCQIFDFQRIRVEDIVDRLKYVANKESVIADENALHLIAQKADGSMRDALSIFDQIVSFGGKKVTWEMVIENLNVLDYEYYFRTVDAALNGDISKILLIFNDVIIRGFDGQNFISGLNSHLRNLLVSKDEVTVSLLDTAPSIREKYIEQARRCTRDFIYHALETGSNCETGYKTSKNQRLHVELTLIKLCRLNEAEQPVPGSEKSQIKSPPSEKKTSGRQNNEIKLNSQTEIADVKKPVKEPENFNSKSDRSVSIKDIINGYEEPVSDEKFDKSNLENFRKNQHRDENTIKFEKKEFLKIWNSICEKSKEEGPRISGMFKSIKPEVHNDSVITLHLDNTALKDLFTQNYKQKVMSILENHFGSGSFNLEIVVDTSENEGIIYSDEQKYQYLSSRYPMIKDIRKAFNLDYE